MTDAPHTGPGWRTAWQSAVRAADGAVLLVELPSTRVLAVSRDAQALLGLGSAAEPELTSSLDDDRRLELIASGTAEMVHGRHRYRRPDRTTVDLWCWMRAVRSPVGPEFALIGAVPVGTRHAVVGVPSPQVIGDAGDDVDPPFMALTLDDGWRVADLRTHVGVGYPAPTPPARGQSVLEVFSASTRTRLLCALALATTGERVAVWLRSDVWPHAPGQPVTAVVTLDRATASFSVEMHVTDETASATRDAARAADLERRLQRIAAELPDVQPGAGGARALPMHARLVGMPPRQVEIVERMLRGDRVPGIARQMHLAPSTVRNHLTFVFRRLGVHSQQELIALLRGEESPPDAGRTATQR